MWGCSFFIGRDTPMALQHTEEATRLYNSKAWKDCRLSYLSTVNYICERCKDVAKIVHHKIYINESNINDVEVTLNHDNLEALCQTCHNQEHFKTESATRDGFYFDIYGNLVGE